MLWYMSCDGGGLIEVVQYNKDEESKNGVANGGRL